MKNRFSVMMMAYNSDSLIKEAIESILPVAYEIIITEGCWDPDKPNRSTDNTIDIIEELQSSNKDIIKINYFSASHEYDMPNGIGYKPKMLGNEVRARTTAVSQMTGDWCFLVDSDEIYKLEDLYKLDEYLDMYRILNEPFQFMIDAFVFFFDYHFGVDHEKFGRISRILEYPPEFDGLRFIKHRSNINPYQEEIPEEIIKMYHYSFIDPERVKTKLNFYEFESNFWFNNIYLPHLKDKSYKENINYYADPEDKYDPNAYNAKRFMKFKGEHPCIVKNQIK